MSLLLHPDELHRGPTQEVAGLALELAAVVPDVPIVFQRQTLNGVTLVSDAICPLHHPSAVAEHGAVRGLDLSLDHRVERVDSLTEIGA